MNIRLQSDSPLPYARFVLENYVAAFLGEGGRVKEFCSGDRAWNLEVEVFGDRSEPRLREFAAFLRRMGVPSDTVLHYVLRDGSNGTINVYESHA